MGKFVLCKIKINYDKVTLPPTKIYYTGMNLISENNFSPIMSLLKSEAHHYNTKKEALKTIESFHKLETFHCGSPEYFIERC